MILFMVATILYFALFLPFPFAEFNFRQVSRYYRTSAAAISGEQRRYPVRFAYLISASRGDAGRLKRTLSAVYHPGNYYLLHMEYGATAEERREVAEYVAAEGVYRRMGNVWVVGKANVVTYRGPTMLATTLHGMAILLRRCRRRRWDWFINLSASDYPLVTQDGTAVSAFFFLINLSSRLHFQIS